MDRYYTASVPEPFTILGRKLKPYSIGHQILLKRFECAFVMPADSIQWRDLALAVLVCRFHVSTRFNIFTSVKAFDSWWGRWLYKRILKSIKRDFADRCKLMLDYIRDGSAGPENVTWKDGEVSYAASESTLKFVLMSKLGYSEERALNMPYAQAVYEFCVWQQSEGMASFFEPEKQADLQTQADEFGEKVRAMMEAKGVIDGGI